MIEDNMPAFQVIEGVMTKTYFVDGWKTDRDEVLLEAAAGEKE